MNSADEKSPVSFEVTVSRLPRKGMPVTIGADADERAALAEIHGLSEVKRFHADLLVNPWKANGVRVSGRLEAETVQPCIITLEPVTQRIGEEIGAVFVPENSALARFPGHEAGEILIDAEGPDAPESFTGDRIDVGALVEEFFALALDPYPRAPGAELENPAQDAAENEARGPLYDKLRALADKKRS